MKIWELGSFIDRFFTLIQIMCLRCQIDVLMMQIHHVCEQKAQEEVSSNVLAHDFKA